MVGLQEGDVAIVNARALAERQRAELLQRDAQLHVDQARRDGRAEDDAVPEVAGQALVVCGGREWAESFFFSFPFCFFFLFFPRREGVDFIGKNLGGKTEGGGGY